MEKENLKTDSDFILDIHSLSKTFSTPTPYCALKNINLNIKKGSIYGIIGSSGAGKSTLIRCLAGLEEPSQGSIIFHQERSLGMIFQHFNLFSFRSALGNVMYPLEIRGYRRIDAEKKALQLLTLVGLEEKKDLYPTKLSGGEKQRVAIARALASSPSLLFSDESTSALDPETKMSILSLLSHFNKTMKLTIILISHEIEVIKEICSDVVVLEKGEIVEQGSVKQLFSHPKHSATKKFLYSSLHKNISF